MTRTATIFKKELKDILRDKRTIITMVVIPLALVPILLTLVVKVAQRQQRIAEGEEIKIALIGGDFAPRLAELVAADTQFTIVEGVAEADIESKIREDSLDGALVIPPHFPDRIETDAQASVKIYFRSSNTLNVTAPKLRETIEAYDEEIVSDRIRRLELDEDLFDAIEIRIIDDLQEQVHGSDQLFPPDPAVPELEGGPLGPALVISEALSRRLGEACEIHVVEDRTCISPVDPVEDRRPGFRRGGRRGRGDHRRLHGRLNTGHEEQKEGLRAHGRHDHREGPSEAQGHDP